MPSKRSSRRPPPAFVRHAASRPVPAPAAAAPVAAQAVAAPAKRAPDDKAFVETVKAPKGTSGTTHVWMAIHARHIYKALVVQAEVDALRALTTLVRDYFR
eukprot:jgi/Tetstr1/428846/TSEL_018833.t1